MAAFNPSLLTWLVLVPLVAWRMVSRFKRMTQRQRLTRARPWVTVTLFPILLYLLAMTAFVPPGPPQPGKLMWLALGVAAGGVLAIYGLKRTRFDDTEQGVFYTPDAKLGIALSTLFIARIAYRIVQLAIHGTDPNEGLQFALSPYTLAPVGLFAGYFIVSAIGLLRHLHKARARKPTRT